MSCKSFPANITIVLPSHSHNNKVTQWEHPLMSLDDRDTEGEYVCVVVWALESSLALAAITSPHVEMHYLHCKHMTVSTNAGNCSFLHLPCAINDSVVFLVPELPEGWEVVTSEQYGIYYVKWVGVGDCWDVGIVPLKWNSPFWLTLAYM